MLQATDVATEKLISVRERHLKTFPTTGHISADPELYEGVDTLAAECILTPQPKEASRGTCTLIPPLPCLDGGPYRMLQPETNRDLQRISCYNSMSGARLRRACRHRPPPHLFNAGPAAIPLFGCRENCTPPRASRSQSECDDARHTSTQGSLPARKMQGIRPLMHFARWVFFCRPRTPSSRKTE